MAEQKETLRVDSLSTSFHTERGLLKAVDGVSFTVGKGEILGLVGESGCGKSVTSQSILRLYDEKYTAHYEGHIYLDGVDLLALSPAEMRKIRGSRISMIFQDALSSLNPVFTVGSQICEPLMIHQGLNRRQAMEKAVELLRLVNIPAPERRVLQYPHELSGGMRQRAAFLRTYLMGNDVALLDEPFSALDALTRADIRAWYCRMAAELGIASVVITHDVDEAVGMASRVYVLEGDPRGGVPSTVAGEVRVERPAAGEGGAEAVRFDLTDEFLRAKREVMTLLG